MTDEFGDIDGDMPMKDIEATRGTWADDAAAFPKQRQSQFYSELLENPDYAQQTARFKAIVVAYARGDTIQDICHTFAISRTEIAMTVKLSGIERGMDSKSMSPADVANLYSLLYAAQLEIESLREQLTVALPTPPDN